MPDIDMDDIPDPLMGAVAMVLAPTDRLLVLVPEADVDDLVEGAFARLAAFVGDDAEGNPRIMFISGAMAVVIKGNP